MFCVVGRSRGEESTMVGPADRSKDRVLVVFGTAVKCSSARVTALLARSLCDKRLVDEILATAHR